MRSLTRKHNFRLGTEGRFYFRILRMTEALGGTPIFDFQVGFATLGRRVFCEGPHAKAQFSNRHPITPFIINISVDSKSRFPKSWAQMGKPGTKTLYWASFP